MKTVRLLIVLAFALASWNTRAEPSLNSMVISGLLEPFGITVDNNSQNYYITDSTHRVFKYSSISGQLTVIAGTTNQGFADGLGLFAQFTAPRGIIFYNNPNTANGNCLIVADSGNHILRLISNLDKLIVTVTNLAGHPGTPGFRDDPNATSALFNNPVGLATDGINLYVADSKNNAIRKLIPNGNAFSVTTIATNLYEPMALAVGDQGEVFVADTRNHAIIVLSNRVDGTYQVTHLAGSTNRVSGANDNLFGNNALFNRPSGLVWQANGKSLLVSDTGNHALRRVYFNEELSDFLSAFYGSRTNIWSVETFAGILGKPGKVDGPLNTAELSSPAQIADDGEQGTLIADTGNNAIRRVQVAAALPQVTQPVIGYVSWVINPVTGEKTSKLVPIQDVVFDHFDPTDPIIAVLGEANTIYYTEGSTPGLLQNDTIPEPDLDNSLTAPPYQDGQVFGARIASIMSSPQPDWTFKARGIAKGRRPSALYTARIQFKVASPYFASDNPAAIVLECATSGATLWYTLDGSDPSEFGSTSVGPFQSGDTINIANQFTGSVTMKVRAFAQGFQPSAISTKTLSLTSYKANKISFGFESGEASSSFIGSAGQWFLAPITMTLLPGATIYSLQFAVKVTALPGSPVVAPGNVGFETMLLKPTLIPGVFTPIYPGMYFSDTNAGTLDFMDLLVTNTTDNLLMVGWLERRGQALLYDSTKQNLLTYSQAHDILYDGAKGKVVVGTYKFQVPNNAPENSSLFQIEISRPSATSDGISRDVFIDTPTSGSPTAGAINAVKVVQVKRAEYIVGDLAPFRWFNAGDFGDGYLLNNDLLQAFQSIAYQLNQPPANCDFLNAMDANNATLNPALLATNGDNTVINSIQMGDGVFDVTDLYVTFRRSLDPSLKWFARYWEGGVLQSREVLNTFRGKPLLAGERVTAATTAPALPPEAASIMASTNLPSVYFSAEDLRAVPGGEVRSMIEARIAGPYPIRVLLLNLTVQNLDGAPPITVPVQFLPNSRLGQAAFTRSIAPNNYCAAWLSTEVTGLWGTNIVGTLVITIPTNATAESSYRISFDHLSSSPNGLGVFPQDERPGLITLEDHNASFWQDGIPDQWRLRYFGSVSNLLSQAMADADGDGVPNWAEFKTGTNPNDVKSVLKLLSKKNAPKSTLGGSEGITLRWPSIMGKKYVVEWTYSLSDPDWHPLGTTIQGSGNLLEIVDPDASVAAKIYRVRLVE